ncbi:HU family DNA-binding protein [Salipiger sp.]|uniref:HU family DNA-binding protein n=1 Tax=Salipiger sp. TaxID=2078585 RepID=UPI003A96BDF1
MTDSTKAPRSASETPSIDPAEVQEATPAPSPGVADDLAAGPDAPTGEAPGELDKKELIERVVTRCGIKKRDAKPSIEAALAILGEALAEGRDLRLEPFGKLKVGKIKPRGNKRVVHARLLQNAAPPSEGNDGAPEAPEG